MAKILISVLPASGHINPMIAIAQALQQEGHQIRVATDGSYHIQLRRAGLEPLTMPYPDGAIAQALEYLRRPAGWLSQIKRHPPQSYFFMHLTELTAALVKHVEDFQPDILLTDLNLYAGPIAAEICQLPYASYCAIVNTYVSPDAPPYGMGIDWYPEDDARRWLWPIYGLGMKGVLWRYDRIVNRVRRQYGLPSAQGAMLAHSPYLALVPTTEAYEYPRRAVPKQLMYIGPVTTGERGEVHDNFDWAWLDDGRPTVYVSMGTIVDGTDIFRNAIEAARGANWKMVMAIGREGNVNKYADAPPNVLVRNFVPQLALLDKVQAVVSHGGNNTVTEALLHGLPLVVIPNSADQPESAGRVKASGVGIRMRPREATPRRLRKSIEAILNDSTYREAARRIQVSYQRCNGPATAAELVGLLAERKTAICRPEGVGITVTLEDVARL
ncbi:MAG: glycosyl transferase [Chloroflexota bacterium]|nr:glycosyltransferase [Chloroflexota bacterium]NOG64596.1 glycosyltransferase [Chloroflexota bacterium]GIK63405.1 MAG: glycosyl transferase [Chloroflexota bacterium]